MLFIPQSFFYPWQFEHPRGAALSKQVWIDKLCTNRAACCGPAPPPPPVHVAPGCWVDCGGSTVPEQAVWLVADLSFTDMAIVCVPVP